MIEHSFKELIKTGNVKDKTGMRYGRLVAIKYHADIKKWECRCDCGNLIFVLSQNLKSGHTKSCGCYKEKKNHGMKGTRIYRIWICMKTRCYNPNYDHYDCYGGKGIKICDEWVNDFMSFYNWSMENGYNDNLSIDRIDVQGNYEPSNCRWISMAEQQSNTSRNHFIEIDGIKKTVSQWAKIAGISVSTIHSRIRKGEKGEKLIREADIKYSHRKKGDIETNMAQSKCYEC